MQYGHDDKERSRPHKSEDGHAGHSAHAYLLFALNMLLSFVAMYLLMYTMVDGWGDFYHNLNMAYMALTMLAAMGAIMLATMPGMYPRRRLNIAIYAVCGVVILGALAGIRTQTPIGDGQFIASMIPHHSGAILMCREADISDAELAALCDEIMKAQREEIEQMRAILQRL
jgi:uncharacterized protein (DUF305 family)